MTEEMGPKAETGGERAADMARRLFRELGSLDLTDAGRERILHAYGEAVELRLEQVSGDDPALLHPGRTVIVLLTDVGPLSVEVFCAAAVAESEDPDLRVGPGRIEEELGEAVARLVRAVPPSGDSRLAERLVLAGEDAQLVALAERLDQLRHAHLWDDAPRLREAHAEAREVYLPVASRVHPVLHRRYRWWCEKFDRG